MDGHKLLWHPERVAEWNQDKPIAPLYIDMGITQTCNVACQFCYYAVPENRTKSIIPTASLIPFFKDAVSVGVKAIGILGDGEPTMHPDFHEIIPAGHAAGLDMAVATNGVLLKQEKLPELLSALKWIRFTLSSATGENYRIMMDRKEKIFDRVIENIRAAIEVKKANKLNVTIGIQMVLTNDCSSQIVPLAKLGKELDVDYFVIKRTSEREGTPHGLDTPKYSEYESLFQEAEAYSTNDYSVIVKRIKMANQHRSYNTCYGCSFLPQITGAGEMYSCGNFFNNKDFLMGDITKKSFKDIVYSDQYRQVLKRVEQQVNVHTDCGIGCRQNEINEHLSTLKSKPQHVNFI